MPASPTSSLNASKSPSFLQLPDSSTNSINNQLESSTTAGRQRHLSDTDRRQSVNLERRATTVVSRARPKSERTANTKDQKEKGRSQDDARNTGAPASFNNGFVRKSSSTSILAGEFDLNEAKKQRMLVQYVNNKDKADGPGLRSFLYNKKSE